METKRILWPTDLSGNAEKALPYVESLALKYQSEIHVLYVIEELTRHESWYGDFDISHIERIHEWEEKKAKERIDGLCEERLKGCPLYHKETAIGDPADEILKFVDKYRIDMIVMTTRGRKSRFSFGSVTEKVLENSPVPVVTIPA
jgi:nucleotide-binding universal stress UspA family protein